MPGDTHAVGIVGCGGIGRHHADTYRRRDDAHVVAAADLDAEALAAFGDEYDVDATYEDHAAMVETEDLDVVSVCTLHSTHAGITIDACEAGVEGVFCEKPMATSLGEAEDMLDAADRNDVALTVGHQRRFDPVHEKARQLVQDGAIGEPRAVVSSSGAGLLNWGTHLVDLTRFLLGDPEYEWVMGQVERRTDRHERGLAIEDRCLGQVCFADGTRLTVESDMPGPDPADTMLQVYGSEGALTVDVGSSVTVAGADVTAEYTPTTDGSNHDAYVDAFFEWLAGERDDHRCSGARGRDAMAVMMALYESARTRGVVEAPLETRANPLAVMIAEGELPVEHPGAYDIRLPYASVRED